MSKYLPQEFEKKWIDYWEKEGVYNTQETITKKGRQKSKQKTYVLAMFPYPSGEGLHVGHVRIYTGTDVLARYFRMQGKYNVLYPMGWDAFGLPAENAAIKARKNPMDMVPQNIANFKRQMKMLGFSYDWTREFSTTDPAYYKWTQWLFIQFFKMGLLYKKLTPVFYCEFCKTGLAEEEVLPDGTHERCGNKITRKELPQWIFKITIYADKLLADLRGLDWPQGILEMQKNWIGRKVGSTVRFKIYDSRFKNKDVEVFTTRLDTIFRVTFLVISPEVADDWIKKGWKPGKSVKDYVEKSIQRTDQQRLAAVEEKTGEFTHLFATHPITGEKIPVWVADYVMSDVGTGAVMGVPSDDERDLQFAKRKKLPIKEVIKSEEKTRQEILDHLEKKGLAKKTVTYHLRDWIFSRQRYWGEPIPMVFCQDCQKQKKIYHTISKLDQKLKENLYGWFPLDEKDLPLALPYLKSYQPSETGGSPLSKVKDWTVTTCPNCGNTKAKRETDTMPNWAGSCWYFLRFADANNEKEAWSEASINPSADGWLPVDWYIGGAEHAVLHLLYSRFWIKTLYDMDLVRFKEPFQRLRNVGLVLGPDGFKMSKSRGNVINPDNTTAEFGADATRIYEMFMAPFSQEIVWSTKTLQGAYRFLKRIWQIYHGSDRVTNSQDVSNKRVIAKLQTTIAKVSSDITNVKFNTAVAAMMEFLNEWEKGSLSTDDAKKFLKILAPFAPFITEEIWKTVFKEKSSIHLSVWPQVSKEKVMQEEINIPVQVNGKLRAVIKVKSQKLKVKSDVLAVALEQEKIKKYLEGKKYRVIYKEGKILNLITT